jgi:hypothetical protein
MLHHALPVRIAIITFATFTGIRLQYPQFMSSLFIRLLIVFTLFSCTNGGGSADRQKKKNSDSRPPAPRTDLANGTIVWPQTSLTGRKYALYLPDSASTDSRYPVLIFLDPHAEGTLPLQQYRELADRYRFMLVGSLEMKNGMSSEDATAIVSDLIQEARIRLPADVSSISLAGFSGGAKAALMAAEKNNGLSGVVYCGAAVSPYYLTAPVPSMGMTGMADMNFSEVLSYHASLDTIRNFHTLFINNGKHEWPDAAAFEHAFLWCKTNQCRISRRCEPGQLDSLLTYFYKLTDRQNDLYIREIGLRHLINSFNGLYDTEKARTSLNKLVNSSGYKNRLSQVNEDLALESTYRNELQRSFNVRDIDWWKEKVRQLNASPKSQLNNRLLGYISLGAYTLSRSSLDRHQLDAAGKYLMLYRTADPDNSEWAFLSACLEAEKGNRNGVVENLSTAVRLGLKDAEKISNERLLSKMTNDPEIAAMIRKLER